MTKTLTLPDTNGAKPAIGSALERLRSRSNVAGHFDVCLDYEWSVELEQAQARANRIGATQADKDAYADLLALRPEKMLRFTFRRLTPAAYERLVKDYPATAEQRREAKERGAAPFMMPTFDPNKLLPALMRASLIEPQLTAEEVTALFESTDSDEALLATGELTELCSAMMQAQTRNRDVPTS